MCFKFMFLSFRHVCLFQDFNLTYIYAIKDNFRYFSHYWALKLQ